MASLGLENIKKINAHLLGQWVAAAWRKGRHAVLAIFWLILAGWGSYLWYVNFYQSDLLSASNSESALNPAGRELKKAALEKVLDDSHKRQDEFEADPPAIRNFFKPY